MTCGTGKVAVSLQISEGLFEVAVLARYLGGETRCFYAGCDEMHRAVGQPKAAVGDVEGAELGVTEIVEVDRALTRGVRKGQSSTRHLI